MLIYTISPVLTLISLLFSQANGLPHFINNMCKGGNYTENSFYKTSLNQLLTSLASQSSSTTFSNLTVGTGVNQVNGLYYCRGDLAAVDCSDCVKDAATEVVSVCPAEKEAVIWYEECTLRYSNRSIFSVGEESPGNLYYSTTNVSNPTEFLDALGALMNQLIDQAALNSSSKNYAKGTRNVTSLQTIYGLVQCTPDLDATQCKTCLTQARGYIQDCCFSGSTDAMINLPSCRLMYDIERFGPGEVRPPSPSPSRSSDTTPSQTLPSPSPSSKGKDAMFYVAIGAPLVGAAVLLVGVLLFCFFCRRKKTETAMSRDITETSQKTVTDEYRVEGATQFDLVTMKTATQDFSTTNKLGEGGFGIVYKGELQNGQKLAIKRLSEESKQGIKEFMNEVQLVVKLQHNNLVRLVGFCTEAEERLVVYEFMPKLSLDYYLFDQSKSKYLTWEIRYKIIEGIARGLQYLHEDSRHKVVHRDLKASNILLDEDMNPKIADFGIAKDVSGDQTQGSNTTRIMGTRGYMAPEYAMGGQFSFKSDVFSFGVILLEIVSGQSNSTNYQLEHKEGLLVHAWKCWNEGEIEELIDPAVRNTVSRMEAGRCIQIGLLCVQFDAGSRPTIHAVLLMLNSINMQIPAPSSPKPSTLQGDRMNTSRHYQGQQTGTDISTTGAWNMEKDLYAR